MVGLYLYIILSNHFCTIQELMLTQGSWKEWIWIFKQYQPKMVFPAICNDTINYTIKYNLPNVSVYLPSYLTIQIVKEKQYMKSYTYNVSVYY